MSKFKLIEDKTRRVVMAFLLSFFVGLPNFYYGLMGLFVAGKNSHSMYATLLPFAVLLAPALSFLLLAYKAIKMNEEPSILQIAKCLALSPLILIAGWTISIIYAITT